jgi:predicted unusual protein kinase regulating ubiquinone biosynthesis (AarF/ABC1/UbiB family)
MFAPLLDRGLSDVGLGEVLKSLFTVLQQFGIGTPQELLLVTKQLVYFEGYSKVLAPSYVLARDLYLVRNLFPDEVRQKAEELGVTLPD